MFSPSRLTLARMRRGKKKTQLAALANLDVRSITAYEAGTALPSGRSEAVLADALSFPVEFFHGQSVKFPVSGAATFRSAAAMTASQRDAAVSASVLAFELANWIERRFSLPSIHIPDLSNYDAETAAKLLRAHWSLDNRPIRSTIHLLEAHGVRVFSLTEDNRVVDAFSLWYEGNPYVFLNTRKSAERSRMDAAHELAHLVLHRDGRTDKRRAELEANRSAAAFLMPAQSVRDTVHQPVNMDQLVILKRTWNVSVAALTYRLNDLGILSEWHHRMFWQQIAQRGYRRNEPNGCDRETSQVLYKVFNELRNDGIGRRQVAAEIHVRELDLNSLIFGLVLLPVAGTGRYGLQNLAEPHLGVVEDDLKES